MLDLVLVNENSFFMGDTFDDYLKDEKPIHTVNLITSIINKYLATQSSWNNWLKLDKNLSVMFEKSNISISELAREINHNITAIEIN